MSKSHTQGKNFRLYILFAVLFAAGILFAALRHHVKEELLTYTKLLTQYREHFDQYEYAAFEDRYNTIIDNYQSGLDSKNLSVLKSCSSELDELEAAVIAANQTQLEKKIKKLKKADLSNAYETELIRIEELENKIERLSETHNFTAANSLLEEWTSILGNMSFVADNLSIYVNQMDTSGYPFVDLYLSIHDIENNEAPSYLVKNYFYLTEDIITKDTDSAVSKSITKKQSSFTNAKLIRLEQLDSNEPVTLSIVTDMGHTRTLDETASIQNSITGFLDMVQFDVQDKVEITALSDSAAVIQEFSSDKEEIISSLSALTPSDSEGKLYDGLMEELERMHTSKTGAKCLIVLTDSEDNTSVHNWEDVVELANTYQIPIAVIGIGKNISPYVLERIGSRTNGSYRNIHDFSSLQSVFEAIYSRMKELYKLEYKSTLDNPSGNPVLLHIACQNRLFGGTCDYTYTPAPEKE